jgi:hypothetical protein
MTTNPDFDRIASAWLADGPTELADRVLDASLREVHLTHQRRQAPWRTPVMSFLPSSVAGRALAAVVVAAVALGGALYFLRPGSNVGAPAPTVAPSPSASAVAVGPSPDRGMPLDTSTWTAFTTSRYGYSVSWPSNTGFWINAPATEDWAGQTADEMWASSADAPWVDKFYDQATQLTMTAVATTMPAAVTQESFIDAYQKPAAATTNPCVEAAKDMPSIVIDGQPARETTKCGGQAAFVAVGRRMYVFSISNQNEVPFLNAYLSTVKLPVDTTSWIPFTSKFYGFTVSHPKDWTVAPGTGRWTTTQSDAALDILTSPSGPPSPVNPPNFMGYENKLPAGETADAFIHGYTSTAYSGACYPEPASTTQITVDGHPATLAFAGCTPQYYFAEVTVVIGNRVWFFDLHGPDRSLIVPFLQTVKLDPTKTVD